MQNYYSVQAGFSFIFNNTIHDYFKEFTSSENECLVYFTNMATGEIWSTSRNEVYRNVIENNYQVVRNGLVDQFISNAIDYSYPSTIALNEKQELTHARRLHYCNHLINKGITGHDFSAIKHELAKMKGFGNEPSKPKPATARLWLLQFYPQNDSFSLISKHALRPKGRYRTHHKIIKIAFDVLRGHYFIQKNNKKNIARKTGHACAIEINVRVNRLRIEEFKEIFPDKEPLTYIDKIPLDLLRCPYISVATVKRLIRSIHPYQRDRMRKHPEWVKQKWQHATGAGDRAEFAFQYVELDHTVSDVYVFDSHHGNIIGRPIISFLVDSYTNYILSVWISFEGENLGRFIKVIEFAYRDKSSCIKEFNLNNEWFSLPVRPLYIRIDNAPSQRSKLFYAIAKALGINPERSAVRTPVMKAGVENLMKLHSDTLPQRGRPIKPGEVAVPGYDPVKDATIGFDDFVAWVFKWIVDVHNVAIPERSLVSPRDLLIEELEKLKGIIPVYPIMTEEFRRDLSVPKRCQVDNNGITLFTVNYRSTELRDLTYQIAPKFKTEIRFDPNDMGSIFVLNEKTRQWITVPATSDELHGKSLFWVKAKRKAQRYNNLNSGALDRHLTAVYGIGAWQDQLLSANKRKLNLAKKDARLHQVNQDNVHGVVDNSNTSPSPYQPTLQISLDEARNTNYSTFNDSTNGIDVDLLSITYKPL